MRCTAMLFVLSCADPAPAPPTQEATPPPDPSAAAEAIRTVSLPSSVLYVRSQAPAAALYVVSPGGTVRRYVDADAVILSPPRLVRFEEDRAYLRTRLDGAESPHPTPVLAPHVTVDPEGVLWLADAQGRLVDLRGRTHPTPPPLPLWGAPTTSSKYSLLAGFKENEGLCITRRCAPNHCWPPIPGVHVDPTRVWGRPEWRLGPDETCHGTDGWVDRYTRDFPRMSCRGCEPAQVLGPRAGWIVWRTQFGSMPRYIAEGGGASAARIGGSDPTVRGPEDGILPHASPVALSPDGQHTLVCRIQDSDGPWPHESRCGVVPTASLDVGAGSPPLSGGTTRSTASTRRPTVAVPFVPVPELDALGDLTDAAVLP